MHPLYMLWLEFDFIAVFPTVSVEFAASPNSPLSGSLVLATGIAQLLLKDTGYN